MRNTSAATVDRDADAAVQQGETPMQDQRRSNYDYDRGRWRGQDRPYDDWRSRQSSDDRGFRGDDRRFPDRFREGERWRDQGDGRYTGTFSESRDRFEDDDRWSSAEHERGEFPYDNPGYGDEADRASRRPFYRQERETWRPQPFGGRPSMFGGGQFSSGPWGGHYQGGTSYRGSGTWMEQNYAGRGPKNYQRSDDRIREEVADRLTDDPRIDASEIDVAVQSGEITLSGTVPDRQQKRLAEDLAESVSGVREVNNHVRIARQDRDESERASRSMSSGSSDRTSPANTGSRSKTNVTA
jgi:hypothetical protein